MHKYVDRKQVNDHQWQGELRLEDFMEGDEDVLKLQVIAALH